MDLTEPTIRSAHEHELAERHAAAGPDARELDLWLLENQVPGCTRERAEQAYAQGGEDVTRALPLARIATLLADRETMAEFLMEQLPGTPREVAYTFYDRAGGDVVEAVINLQREAGWQLRNQPILDARSRQRLRTGTVFMLALLYRERYGQLERVVEDTLAERSRGGGTLGTLTQFRTADGSRWTHTRAAGWQRRAPPQATNLDRAVRATEQLADAAAARGHAETAIRARRTAEEMRTQLHGDEQAPPSPPSPPVRSTIQRDANGLEARSTVVIPVVHYERLILAQRNSAPLSLREGPDGTGSVSEDDSQPPALAAGSSSSEDDEGNETPTAGTYARPRAFVRSAARLHPRDQRRDQRRDVTQRNLRIVQERLDAEMANAAQGVVMSEGGYIAMMNAIKVLWEQVDPHPGPVEVN